MDRHHRKYNTDTGLENFILRLKECNPDIEYYSNYIDSDKKVKLKCNKCGNIFERYASCVRKNKKIRCYECKKINTQNIKEYMKTQKQNIKEFNKKAKRLLNNKQLHISICLQCNKLFIGDNKYCSKECLNKYHNTVHAETRKRYKVINGQIDYTITLDKLIKRDNNICYICNKECNLNDYTYQGNYKIAGNYYPSIDHVIPIAKGGTHTWNNVRLAHRICNSIKSDN